MIIVTRFLLLCAGLLALPAVAVADESAPTLSPVQGPVGTLVTASASDWTGCTSMSVGGWGKTWTTTINSSGAFSLSFTVPAGAPLGAQQLQFSPACLHSAWMPFLTFTVTRVSALADLSPTAILYNSADLVPGRTVFFDSGIQNSGSQGTGVFNVRWFVDGVSVGYGSHAGVPANSTVLNGNSQYWWPATAGTHTITFVVDSDNHALESNESNNSISVTVTVTSPLKITLATTVRDFCGIGFGAEACPKGFVPNPDFENSVISDDRGLVGTTLSKDKTPLPIAKFPTTTVHSKDSLNQWYHDKAGINKTTNATLTLNETSTGSGMYIYNNNNFFPIDNKLLGNERQAHNYSFTLALNTTFKYKNGQVLEVAGDDDIWVFINNQLVIDLGGVHPVEGASVNLDTLGLEVGQNYNFDLFFAERHIAESNLKLQTSIIFEPLLTTHCPGAAFQFPLIDGWVGWLYADKRSTDKSGDHTGIDIFPPVKDDTADVYPLAAGLLKEVNRGGHSFEVYYPDQGVTSYMAHVDLKPGLHDDSPVSPDKSLGNLLLQKENTHLHFSLKHTGAWSHYNDQQPLTEPDHADDPSDWFNANLNDPSGASNSLYSTYPPYRHPYQDFCRR